MRRGSTPAEMTTSKAADTMTKNEWWWFHDIDASLHARESIGKEFNVYNFNGVFSYSDRNGYRLDFQKITYQSFY